MIVSSKEVGVTMTAYARNRILQEWEAATSEEHEVLRKSLKVKQVHSAEAESI